jgi:hypothetical protein
LDAKDCVQMKSFIFAIAILAVSGCSTTTTARMDFQSINQFRVNCAKKQEQLDFLYSQWPSKKDQFLNAMMIRSDTGFVASVADDTYRERRYLDEGRYTAVLRLLIDQVKQCPNY